MMREVGVLEAKTHLSSLLDEVERGGELAITRHGRIVARLVGPQIVRKASKKDIAAAFSQLRQDIADRYGVDPDFDWKAAVDEGRE